jgi:hypothetical protein
MLQREGGGILWDPSTDATRSTHVIYAGRGLQTRNVMADYLVLEEPTIEMPLVQVVRVTSFGDDWMVTTVPYW